MCHRIAEIFSALAFKGYLLLRAVDEVGHVGVGLDPCVGIGGEGDVAVGTNEGDAGGCEWWTRFGFKELWEAVDELLGVWTGFGVEGETGCIAGADRGFAGADGSAFAGFWGAVWGRGFAVEWAVRIADG